MKPSVVVILVLIVSIALSILLLVVYKQPQESMSIRQPNSTDSSIELTPQHTPTPVPFEELTIPYLRARSYNGALTDINFYEDHPSYTSYLSTYDSDGLNINGLFTIPKGTIPDRGWPAVVFVHGYIPPRQYETTEKYAAYVDNLARNGIIVFKIDLRGHGTSEGEPGGAYYSPDYVIDTLNAYEALAKHPFVDKSRIGLWGHSMAGNVVFRAAVVKQIIPHVVIWAGAGYTYSDLQEYGISDQSYQMPTVSSTPTRRRQALFAAHGRFSPDSEFWKQVVPTNHLSGVTSTIHIHHAVDDATVSIRYSEGLADILRKNNVDHELFTYPSGGHNISGSSFTSAMSRTVSLLTAD